MTKTYPDHRGAWACSPVARRTAIVLLMLLALTSLLGFPSVAHAADLAVGSAVEVTATGGDGLNVRSAASTTSQVVGVQKDGARGMVLEGPVTAGGFRWWRIQWGNGLMGWSVDTYLRVPPPNPLPGAPTSLVATPGVESVTLSWGAPEGSGTSPVTAWRIYRDRHADPSTLVATLQAGQPGFDQRTWTDGPMLLGGATYWYAVSAVNAAGEGKSTEDVQTVPQTAPLPAGIFFLPPELDFGGDQSSLVLTLQNSGTAAVTFSILPGDTWMSSVSPASGSIPTGGVQRITVTAQRANMPSGTYESLVRVQCSTGSINIPAHMRIGMIQGIDVSRWQCSGDVTGDPINWASVRSAGYRFVFVKATESVSIEDAYLDVLAPGARAAGLLTGVYHVCWPADNTPEAEAAYFLQNARQYITAGFLIPVLDLEPRYNIHGAAMVAWIDRWAGAVKAATGATPAIYCSSSVAADLLKGDPTIAGRYPLWIASYITADQPNTGGWNTWAFWQYTSTGKVPGIEGHNVDLDCFNGSEDTLAQYVITGKPSSCSLVTAVMGNGVIGISPQQTSYAPGTTVTLSATAVPGWEFVGWSGTVTSTANPLVVTMNSNMSILGTFRKSAAPLQHVITLSVGSSTAHLDGQEVALDSPPVIVGGRTLVPLRPIIEGLGGALTWIPETRSVEVELGGVTIQLQIGNQTAIVNGQSVTMDVPAAIINSRTMLPVRFVSENIGADVDWEDLTRTVTIRVTVSSTLGGTALQPLGRSTGPAA